MKRYRDFLWLGVMLVLAYLAYRVIPAIDPRSGIDGWGDLFNTLVMSIKGLMATIGAWLCQSLYWREMHSLEDESLHDTLRFGSTTRDAKLWALVLIGLDRLEFMLWLGFWAWVLF